MKKNLEVETLTSLHPEHSSLLVERFECDVRL